MLFWDIRFQDIADGKLLHIARPRGSDKKQAAVSSSTPGAANAAAATGSANVVKALWTPLFRMQVGVITSKLYVFRAGQSDAAVRRPIIVAYHTPMRACR